MEIVMRPHLLDPAPPPPPQLVGLRLGPSGSGRDRCAASRSADGEFIIRAPLAECGSRVTFTDDAVLYSNMLLFFFPGSSAGETFKSEGAAVPVLCRYKRRYAVSSGALRPTWTSVVSVHSAHLSLDFYLSLMTASLFFHHQDDWSSERNPPVYFMSEMVNILASIDHHHHHHPPLRLHAGSCVATLTPDVDSHPRYPFIDHQGCFTDSQLSGSGSRFLPRVRDDLLHIQLEPFLFHQDRRHSVSAKFKCFIISVPAQIKKKKRKRNVHPTILPADLHHLLPGSCSPL
ncbi:zona pellucida sperm-binding protein 3-like [Xiphophorus hellerii]|uniref:zona pellucida sperm-binding protein 3-like n=1 Tax=Xiphophorus hellerii TaxID=8084 RepID=UPI0013B4151E|nr:zona pellucida sperm-binding protein 3-like [Xiphophorus hellerii]